MSAAAKQASGRPPAARKSVMTSTQSLTPVHRQALLQVARRTLEQYLTLHVTPNIECTHPILMEHRGAFVTLHQAGALRGCIGTFEATDPLWVTIQRMAISAATGDPRFPSVTAAELAGLHFEISVLSPLREASPEEIQVGTHGIYLSKGYQRGVLLPQVAVEHGWDRDTFLKHTCQKAGLPTDAWKDPLTKVEIFSADVFGEEPEPHL